MSDYVSTQDTTNILEILIKKPLTSRTFKKYFPKAYLKSFLSTLVYC